MNKLVKSVLSLSITAALCVSASQAATYKIIDKGAASKFKYTYAQQENNNGQMAVSGTEMYNFPVQYQYLNEGDFNDIVTDANRNHELVNGINDIEDEEALRAGNPTANDLFWVERYLRSIRGDNELYQKYGSVVAMTNFGDESIDFAVYDQFFEGTETLTRSTVDYVNGITDQGWVYGNGSAPYLPVRFVDSNTEVKYFWIREFTTRGFLTSDRGQTILPIMPPEATYGGESSVLDVSDNGIAVGFASVDMAPSVLERIQDEDGGCADPNVIDDIPVEACIQAYVGGLYQKEAYKWNVDANGTISSEGLGLLITPHEEDDRQFESVAQAVNSHGVAVGYSHGWVDETETQPAINERADIYAVVFKDGQVKDFTEDHGKYFTQRAYDINDSGIAVGHTSLFSNGYIRTSFFHVDTNEENPLMVMPEGFFDGSSSSARSINEHGIVVGKAEVENHNDSPDNPRRTHGFMYDIASDTFTDLNTFLSCDSDYTIIEANDINDNNEISAVAIVKVDRRDAKGEIMLGEDGEPLKEDVVRAVKMEPLSGGEIEDCTQQEDKVERQGAGFGFFGISLLALFGFGRRFRQ